MQKEPSKKYYTVTVVLSSGTTRTIGVKASSREVAESRALKRTIGGVRIQREGEK